MEINSVKARYSSVLNHIGNLPVLFTLKLCHFSAEIINPEVAKGLVCDIGLMSGLKLSKLA